jgi:hypothetical protein
MLLAVAHPAAVVSSRPSTQAPTLRWFWPPKQRRCHALPLAWLLWFPVWSQVLSRYGVFEKRAPPTSSGHLNQLPSAGQADQVWLAGLLIHQDGPGVVTVLCQTDEEKADADVSITVPGSYRPAIRVPGQRHTGAQLNNVRLNVPLAKDSREWFCARR